MTSSLFLLEAIRTRYRVSKFHYSTFYKDHIQETLAGCLYNEGTRKPRQQAIQQRAIHQQAIQQQQPPPRDEEDSQRNSSDE